ncbi:hypothetical protein [Hymenobacter properus]|uniref:Uncharacterized protein n=1 Tax=Hymenobacter properus TaxID=2791026 RepID=A0A931FKP2_9BACT|nr:hypothetical protein [Hymenobacter properus]MBF9143293.1 hypothetical protein [Hymenobacter properus]MBR7722103.1 hypothetical protein [Microvirga sp. SRT04]
MTFFSFPRNQSSMLNSMRLTNAFTAALLGINLFSCGSDKASQQAVATVAKQAVTKDSIVAATPATTHLDACGERMKEFLRWYLDLMDYEKPSSEYSSVRFKIPISPETDSALAARVAPEQRSSTKYYQIDWHSVDSYLAMLGKSGYFSKSYLQEKRASLLRRGKALDAAKMEDGEPEGFEADEVFWMMELYAPSDIDRVRVYRVPNAKIRDGIYELPVELPGDEKSSFLLYTKKENGRCVIDSVARLFNGEYSSVGNK